jgi:uncharacterized membrane protein YagU involved in acid resistance
MALALPGPSNVMTHLGQTSSQSGITAFSQHFLSYVGILAWFSASAVCEFLYSLVMQI